MDLGNRALHLKTLLVLYTLEHSLHFRQPNMMLIHYDTNGNSTNVFIGALLMLHT